MCPAHGYGSPLSPLCFAIFVADLPASVLAASPSTQVIMYADDVTFATRDSDPLSAARRLQPALDALSNWAHSREVQIAVDKSEAVVITLDPAQVNGKCRPPLYLNGQELRYNASPKILGVTFDSQLRFTAHTSMAVAKLKGRVNVLKALSGTSWGANERTLRDLYVGYARPAALYAAGD